MMVTAMNVNLPAELVSQAQQFVRDGWVADLDDLLAEALRRYLDSHGPALTKQFVREDITWGLHGQD